MGSDSNRSRAPAGLVVHPEREIGSTLRAIGDWATERGIEVGQIAVAGQDRRVAEPIDASRCGVIVAVGGDGTALAALHAAARASTPVLGVACGSVGALTSVGADRVTDALDRFEAGDWVEHRLPALDVGGDEQLTALNDLAVVRDGDGQTVVAIWVDDELYARVAGDGVVACTPTGSSAYSMAAGGPLLAPTCDTFAVTPIAPHGGSAPALVVGRESHVRLEIEPGFGGIRIEVDGRRKATEAATLEISRRPDYARLIGLEGDESMLAGLRRRDILLDSPRAVIRQRRRDEKAGGGQGR